MINRKCILAIEWTYLWIPLCLIRRNYGLISAISRKWQRKSLVGFRLINRRFMPTMKWTYLWFSGQLAIIRPRQCNTHTNISRNAKFHHFIRFLVALHVFYKHNVDKHTGDEIFVNIFGYRQKYWPWEIFDYVWRKLSSWNVILSSPLGGGGRKFDK